MTSCTAQLSIASMIALKDVPSIPGPSPMPALFLRQIFSAALNRALRALGLAAVSGAEGRSGLRVRSLSDAAAPQAHTGSPGGHTHAPAAAVNASFTILSSSE